jgi:hypothetical protein
MIDIPFTWEGKGDFHNALYSPIQRASLTMLVGRPSVLFLWHTDGSCLRIANKMHDLGDRVEVGSLSFGDKGPSDKAEFEVDVCVHRVRCGYCAHARAGAYSGLGRISVHAGR